MTLKRRLAHLEKHADHNRFDGLADGEIIERLVQVCREIESRGGVLPLDWQGLIAAGDYHKLEVQDAQ